MHNGRYTFFEPAVENAYVANELCPEYFGSFYRRQLDVDAADREVRILDIFDPNDPGTITARFRYTGRALGQSKEDWRSEVKAKFAAFHAEWLEKRRPKPVEETRELEN